MDPIKHPGRRKVCFEEALFSNDPQADHLPITPGARIRLRLLADDATAIGEISTIVRLRPYDGGVPGSAHTLRC